MDYETVSASDFGAALRGIGLNLVCRDVRATAAFLQAAFDMGIHRLSADFAIVTYGNGRYLSTQAQAELEARGIKTRVVDLRWLAPLPADALIEATRGCKNVLIVDECRTTGSQSEALMALFAERSDIPAARIAAGDCFIATGPAYAATLPSKDSILAAALDLVGAKA